MAEEIDNALNPVFLFSILGMGAGPSKLGKFCAKNRNWEKLKPVKSLKVLKSYPSDLAKLRYFSKG